MNNDVDTISSSSTSQPTESLSSSTSTTSSSSSSSSIQNQNQNQHSDSSTNGDASAASYFLKKKAERSGSVPMAPLTLKTDCTPEQYKAMYERAVKDNQLLVKKYNERSAECKKLKDDLKKTPAVRESARTSRVISREQRVSMAMSTQLGGQLGNLLSLVQNLDEQIKASESARQYAEEKLIEMALQKIDVTEALKKVDDALEKVATRMRGGGNVDKELVANIITKIRKDILGADVDDAPAASAHPDAAAAATATAAAAAAAQKPSRGGLLAQIRTGVQLSRVDVEKLKEARSKDRIRTARQSVRMMQSLEQTLRDALEMRQFEMNPDDPTQVELDEDWE
jgi:uncharacterized protein YqgV (UPF0045/DUF77 family)